VKLKMFENIVWLAIGFVPTYGAMELAWRIAKRRIRDKVRTATAPEITVTTRTTMVPTSQ
jgi:hypothetical protein